MCVLANTPGSELSSTGFEDASVVGPRYLSPITNTF